MLGSIVVILSLCLVYLSDSKTALGLAILCPLLAGLTLVIKRMTTISVAIILLQIPLSFTVLTYLSNLSIERISYIIYGDSTLTGRTFIWDFANYEINRRPLLGWGYQSFWLVGPDAPSVVDAPGWLGTLTEAHNGYYDTKLELGYIGYTLLLIFIISTLHGIGRVADHNPARAWSILSLALYVILYNLTESVWLRSFEFLWVTFLILVVEVARCLSPVPSKRRRRLDVHPLGRGLRRDPYSQAAGRVWPQ